ncbi:aspartyl protease family protein [Hephaestia sp. GCM10023244]|uniref:aspartyl protease family protein n=1 Tax=unclassified Hephaestia TaxID=2631281 RepID=UPI00207703EF|nr:aspartyl protease family protein [Hephaestia sp. MAHUQ-44]MCM8731047.1 retroviral-like aspartic protease family protein [Hephaestia sp. MAHUQ-44]
MRDLAALALALVATPAGAQTLVPPAATASETTPADELAMLIALGDADDRMTVPVSIGGSGPYDFIVDTGSERTVISRQLAKVLDLQAGPQVRITAMTGTSMAGTVHVPALNVSKLRHEDVTAPALEGFNIGAPGMLGLDVLQGRSVIIDFDRNEMMVTRPGRSDGFSSSGGDIVVYAKSAYGQLIVTNARYHGKRIAVVIDTGSPLTVGNSALRAIMRQPPHPLGVISILSATGGYLYADYTTVDQIEIGGIAFRNVGVAFADAAPFARFGLSDTPALLLGMDSLRLFRRVKIDFKHRSIHFDLPRTPGYRNW